MWLVNWLIRTETIRSGIMLSRRRRRNKLRRKGVNLDIMRGIEEEKKSVLVVGTVEEGTAGIGSRRGRRLESAMPVESKAISGKIVECPGRIGSIEKEIFNL